MEFDTNYIEECERIMKQTWEELTIALLDDKYLYSDTDKFLKNISRYTFLKVFNDVFKHVKHTVEKNLDYFESSSLKLVRATRLSDSESNVNYERLIPKSEYIKEHNRFSPKGVEWLYLAFSEIDDRRGEECALEECRAKSGDKFALCNFNVLSQYKKYRIVDLTISNDKSYEYIDTKFEQNATKRIFMEHTIDIDEDVNVLAANLYFKMLAEQIFTPIKTENKAKIYAPFHCMAYYFKSMGYNGIIYNSTVYRKGKNLVLFDKNFVKPYGDIRNEIIT